jgi:hypothetical protein
MGKDPPVSRIASRALVLSTTFPRGTEPYAGDPRFGNDSLLYVSVGDGGCEERQYDRAEMT